MTFLLVVFGIFLISYFCLTGGSVRLVKKGAVDSFLRPMIQNTKNILQNQAYAMKQHAAMGAPASADELKGFIARGEVMQGPLPKKKKQKGVYV